MRIAVVGAGASGLMVAGGLQQKGQEVVVFDSNEKAGKKLYITGKGRCNLTNLCQPADFLTAVVRGDKFLRSAIYNFSSFDAVEFFEGLGLKTKVERGNRVFPLSDKSSDVIKVLGKAYCKDVKFRFCEKVEKIEKEGGKFKVFTACPGSQNSTKGFDLFDCVVIATGGKSYSATGSDGFGYDVAKSFGHNIVPIVAALCPIKLKDNFTERLQGVSLKNVRLNALADGKKMGWQGEMMFTSDGITGPIVLTASSNVNRCKRVVLSIDFKPALSEQTLNARLLREFENAKNKQLQSVLNGLLPKSVAEVFGQLCGVDPRKMNNSVTKEERTKIVNFLKNFPLDFAGLYPLEAGIVTSGGVELKQVDPKTFESKLVKGLYFVGEVLDCDALTGGFNLQIAWATAQSMVREF